MAKLFVRIITQWRLIGLGVAIALSAGTVKCEEGKPIFRLDPPVFLSAGTVGEVGKLPGIEKDIELVNLLYTKVLDPEHEISLAFPGYIGGQYGGRESTYLTFTRLTKPGPCKDAWLAIRDKEGKGCWMADPERWGWITLIFRERKVLIDHLRFTDFKSIREDDQNGHNPLEGGAMLRAEKAAYAELNPAESSELEIAIEKAKVSYRNNPYIMQRRESKDEMKAMADKMPRFVGGRYGGYPEVVLTFQISHGGYPCSPESTWEVQQNGVKVGCWNKTPRLRSVLVDGDINIHLYELHPDGYMVTKRYAHRYSDFERFE
ncbi:MAG: hypothetical protein ABIT23_01405 [Nitrosospira sp.]